MAGNPGDKTDGVLEFPEDVDPHELRWHLDGEDRVVIPVHDTDWKIQFDNELRPRSFGKKGTRTFVPGDAFHRVIKGSGPFKFRIEKPEK